MTKQVMIFDALTGEEIVRDMTDEELAQWKIDEAAAIARKAEIEAQKRARQEILMKLGITEEEAKLLLG